MFVLTSELPNFKRDISYFILLPTIVFLDIYCYVVVYELNVLNLYVALPNNGI